MATQRELESLLWNPGRGVRAQDEWRRLLSYLLTSLINFLHIEFDVLDIVISDNAASLSIRERDTKDGCLRIKCAGGLSTTLRNGVPGVYVVLFPFVLQERVSLRNDRNHIIIRYSTGANMEGAWSNPQWCEDTYGE